MRTPDRPRRASPARRSIAALGLVGVVGLVGLLSAACTGAATPDPPTASRAGPLLTWTRQSLPGASTALTLTPVGDRLLIGATVPVAGPDPSNPRMYLLDAAGRATSVPLTPSSPYAFLARWYSVAAQGTQVVAIGGATGGAHGNVRWTTWAGSSSGVAEQTQNFLTFGGEDAGQLLDAVITPQGPVLVGTWASAVTGQDAAIWLQDNAIWRRQSAVGTALQSTPDTLVGPRAAVASGSGVVVVGSAVHLADGSVAQSAALWRSSGPDSGWHRLGLPGAGRASEAVSVRCDDLHCLVAGHVDGRLALWDVVGDAVTREPGIPALAVADDDALPPPVTLDGDDTLVVPGGDAAVVLSRTALGWATSPGPTGRPVRAAVVGTQLWVTTVPSTDGVATLWRAAR